MPLSMRHLALSYHWWWTLLHPDVRVLNLERNKWIDIKILQEQGLPTPRHSHAAVIYGENMYTFGGESYIFTVFPIINKQWVLLFAKLRVRRSLQSRYTSIEDTSMYLKWITPYLFLFQAKMDTTATICIDSTYYQELGLRWISSSDLNCVWINLLRSVYHAL
jgi:hypothetical protein